jgi:hypothetical protein
MQFIESTFFLSLFCYFNLKRVDVRNEGGIPIEAEVGAAAGPFSLTPRSDKDFTEKLWSFSLAAINLRDLISSMNAVVEALETGRLQPMVHRTNQSQLARLVRDCLKILILQNDAERKELKASIGQQFDYWLEQGEESPPVLELFIEVGIEKLRQDYTHWLVGQNMLSFEQVQSLLDPLLSSTDLILRLHFAHRIFELWNLLRQNLPCLPYESLRSLVQMMYGFWMKHLDGKFPFDETLSFTFELPRFSSGSTQVLETILKSFQPHTYSTTLCDELDENWMSVTMSETNLFKNAGVPVSKTDLISEEDMMMQDVDSIGKNFLMTGTCRRML